MITEQLIEQKQYFDEIYRLSPLGAWQLTEYVARENEVSIELSLNPSREETWEALQAACHYSEEKIEEALANVLEEMNAYYFGE